MRGRHEGEQDIRHSGALGSGIVARGTISLKRSQFKLPANPTTQRTEDRRIKAH
jgi:hypothetical protein